MIVIGVDPGPLIGMAFLWLVDDTARPSELTLTDVLQTTPGLLDDVLSPFLTEYDAMVAVEKFVVGYRASRSSSSGSGQLTRDVLAEVSAITVSCNRRLVQRSASEVKPWATDKRLEAAGLMDMTVGMRHARDAARHALFTAVRDYGLPDPLSKPIAQRSPALHSTYLRDLRTRGGR